MPISARSFADFLPHGQFAELAQHGNNHVVDESGNSVFSGPEYVAWSTRCDQLSDGLNNAIWQYLQALKMAGRLAPIEFTEGRGLQFADAWNRMLSGTEPGPWDFLAIVEKFSDKISRDTLFTRSTEEEISRRYAQTIERMDGGNFACHLINGELRTCLVTGDRMSCQITSWRPEFGKVTFEGLRSEFKPLIAGIPLPVVEHHVIDAPSGEILIADWFRIEAFSKLVDHARYVDSKLDLNSDAGKLARTTMYANRFNFAAVFVGNSSPDVASASDPSRPTSGDARFTIGCPVVEPADDDARKVDKDLRARTLGNVCTDLWWVTIIDKEILIRTVACGLAFNSETGGIVDDPADLSIRTEAATGLVDAYLSKGHNSIVRAFVTPGTKLHVYHTSDVTAMQQFESPDVNGAGVEELFCVLSQRELAWSPKEGSRVVAQPVADDVEPTSARAGFQTSRG